MLCPKCGKEMAVGYLCTGGNRVVWTRRQRRWSTFPAGDDVILQPFTLGNTLGGKNPIRAYLCRNCRRAILDY